MTASSPWIILLPRLRCPLPNQKSDPWYEAQRSVDLESANPVLRPPPPRALRMTSEVSTTVQCISIACLPGNAGSGGHGIRPWRTLGIASRLGPFPLGIKGTRPIPQVGPSIVHAGSIRKGLISTEPPIWFAPRGPVTIVSSKNPLMPMIPRKQRD